MFGDKMNLMSMMKNAKKMQEMMETAQKELANLEVTGEAGAGAVKVTMSGEFFVKNIQIEPTLFKEEPGIIEDLIAGATNQAIGKVKEHSQSMIGGGSNMLGDLLGGAGAKE